MLGDCAFGAQDVEATFLSKSLGNLLVSLHPSSKNKRLAEAIVAQLSYSVCDRTAPSKTL
jgi:hypothetical protein